MYSKEDINELRKWVKVGHLNKVKELVEAGIPLLEPEGSRRKSLLEIAVETGFYSMVEFVADVWPQREDLDSALCTALMNRYGEIAKLLVTCGADINYPSLGCVASCYDRELMRFFLDRVDDPCANNELAGAVSARIRPLIGILRSYAAKLPGGQVQLTKALKDFVEENDPKWVSLVQWMGADPRLRVPDYRQTEEDVEEWSSPLEEAFTHGRMDVIRCFKLDPAKDEPTTFLSLLLSIRMDVVDHLLKHGADINDKPNGGCSLLDKCFRDICLKHRLPFLAGGNEGSWYDVENLIKRGARLAPSDQDTYRNIREVVVHEKNYDWRKYIKRLATAAQPEVMHRILNTQMMRRELGVTANEAMAELKIGVGAETKSRRRTKRRSESGKRAQSKDARAFGNQYGADPGRRPPSAEHRKAIYVSRHELYEQVWTRAISQLAADYGLSDVGLAKVCNRHNIPRPGRGYWAKVQSGRRPRRRKLPTPEDNYNIQIWSRGDANRGKADN